MSGRIGLDNFMKLFNIKKMRHLVDHAKKGIKVENEYETSQNRPRVEGEEFEQEADKRNLGKRNAKIEALHREYHADKWDAVESVTHGLAISDKYLKMDQYNKATEMLYMKFRQLEEIADGTTRFKENLDNEELNKLADSIDRRIQRLSKKAINSKPGEVDRKSAYRLTELIKQNDDFRKKRGLELRTYGSYHTAVAGIIGIIGGLLFLSVNITGNAIIGNITTTSSNVIGALLFIAGIIGVIKYIKER